MLLRVLLTGSLELAALYVPIAKKWARTLRRQRILTKTWHLGAVTIRIETLPGVLQKVEIDAQGGRVYQFFDSYAPVNRADGVLQGSAVALRLPRPVWTPTPQPIAWEKVKAQPTGSTREAHGSDPMTPPLPPTSASMQRVFWLRGPIVQADGVPEPVYAGFRSKTDAPDELQETPATRCLYSWASRQGQIRMAGAYMPTPAFIQGDVQFDLSPTTLRAGQRRCLPRIPDADWPHDAARVIVTHADYGPRAFIVLVDASGQFYCWADQYDSSDFLGGDSPYLAQGIKTNVPSDRAQTATPPWPDWAYAPVGTRRDEWIEKDGKQSLEPRYVWRFHPDGSKVVGMLLKRDDTPLTVWGERGTAHIESDVGAFEVYTERQVGAAEDDATKAGVRMDTPGWAEFAVQLEITGPNRADFTFALTLGRHELASATHYPIAAGYLNPVKGGWAAREVSAAPGDLLVAYLDVRLSTEGKDYLNLTCGYQANIEQLLRQTWCKIVNYESSTTLLKLLLADSGHNEQHLRWHHRDYADYTWYQGRLFHLDLSTFTVGHWLARRHVTLNTATPLTQEWGYRTGSKVNVLGQKTDSEVGVRLYVFGKIEQEKQYGPTLGVWTGADAIEETGDYWPATTTDTLWVHTPGTSDSELSNRHWLLDTVAWRSAQEDGQEHPCFYALDTADALTETEFKTVVMAEIKAALINTHNVGGVKTALSPTVPMTSRYAPYTDAYWNDYVLPLCWKIYQGKQAMYASDDFLDGEQGLRGFKELYLLNYYPFYNRKVATTTGDRYQRVYDAPVGLVAYQTVWYGVCPDDLNLYVTVDAEGFYALCMPVCWDAAAAPSMIVYDSEHEHFPDMGVEQRDYSLSGVDDAGLAAAANAPYSTRFGYSPLDVASDWLPDVADALGAEYLDLLSHINGGETSHVALSNAAYQRAHAPADYLPTLQLEIPDSGPRKNMVLYHLDADYWIDGEPTDPTRLTVIQGVAKFFTHQNWPRANASALFA